MKEKLKEWKNKVLTPERIRDLRDLRWYVFGFGLATLFYDVYINHNFYLFEKKMVDDLCDKNGLPRFYEMIKRKR